jgi:hypothetical protein
MELTAASVLRRFIPEGLSSEGVIIRLDLICVASYANTGGVY